MTNRVSFIIQLKDQFGKTAEKVNRQFEKMKKSADKANRSVRQFATKGKLALGELGKKATKLGAIMTAAVTVPLGLMARQMVKAASDAQETSAKFNAVFSEIRGEANSAARDFAKSFKLADSTAKEMIGTTGDLLTGFGFTDRKALDLSKTINTMALDLARFQNLEGGAPRASRALTSALTGETEGLKALGISFSQNSKKFQTLMKQNLRLTNGSIVQAKALSILTMAQQQSTKSVGAYLAEAEGYEGVLATQQEATKRLSEEFGKVMLPLAIKLTKALTKLVEWVGGLSPHMKNLVVILAGLVAIGGPLLLVLGGIAAAMTVITLPVLAVSAAVLGLIAAGALLYANWEGVIGGLKALWNGFAEFFDGIFGSIGDTFTLLFQGRLVDAIKSWANVSIKIINKLIEPLDFISHLLGFDAGTIKIPEVNINIDDTVVKKLEAASTPTQSLSGTLDGRITVEASPGTQVKETSLATKSATGFNLGMNMAAL